MQTPYGETKMASLYCHLWCVTIWRLACLHERHIVLTLLGIGEAVAYTVRAILRFGSGFSAARASASSLLTSGSLFIMMLNCILIEHMWQPPGAWAISSSRGPLSCLLTLNILATFAVFIGSSSFLYPNYAATLVGCVFLVPGLALQMAVLWNLG